MSGIIVPANPIVRPFGASASNPAYITLPIPNASQISVTPGAASFEDGFPPATMSDPETAGGVPPFGQDFNGLMYMLSAYCALLQAGQLVTWNSVAATAFSGYKVGARVASTATPGRVWVNQVDGNANDPDVTATGWAADSPIYATSSPAAGSTHDLVLPGASDYALDFNTAAGAVDITGMVAQRNGQRVYASNTGANLLQFLANNVGSSANNRIRAASDIALVQNQTITLEWITGLNKWLLV